MAFGAHILVVTAAVMGVARIRGWRWLAIGGIAGSTGLALLLLTISTLTAWFTLGLLLVALFAVHVTSMVAGIEARPDPLEDRPAARLAIGAVLCVVLVGVLAILTWDTNANPALAFMIATMSEGEMPTPIGIFRNVARESFDAAMHRQLGEARAKYGEGNLEKLLYSGDVWEVK